MIISNYTRVVQNILLPTPPPMLLYQLYITMTIYKIILWKSAKDDLIPKWILVWKPWVSWLKPERRHLLSFEWPVFGGIHCWWLLFMILSQWLSIQRNKTGQRTYVLCMDVLSICLLEQINLPTAYSLGSHMTSGQYSHGRTWPKGHHKL